MKTSEPLTDIFKSSPDLGEILEDLKAANMTMLFQKGQDRSKRKKKTYEHRNLREVSLTKTLDAESSRQIEFCFQFKSIIPNTRSGKRI